MSCHKFYLKFLLIYFISTTVQTLKNEKIIGDDKNVVANPEDYGYHVTLLSITHGESERSTYSTRTVLCGGSIISEQHVITAAHCLKKIEWADEVYIVLANHVVHTSPVMLSNYLKASEAFVPFDYNYISNAKLRFAFDFGVVKVNEKLSKDKYPFIQKVRFPTSELLSLRHLGLRGKVLGRGISSLGKDKKGQLSMHYGDADDKLRSTEIKLLPYTISYKYVKELGCGVTYSICGTHIDKHEHIEHYGALAQGDSGGGLVHDGDILIGVVTAVTDYNPGTPNVVLFANASYNKRTIFSMINDNINPEVIEKHVFGHIDSTGMLSSI